MHALAVCDARVTKHFHLSAMDEKGTFTDFIRLCRACNVTAKRDANHSTVIETSALTERFTEIFSALRQKSFSVYYIKNIKKLIYEWKTF